MSQENNPIYQLINRPREVREAEQDYALFYEALDTRCGLKLDQPGLKVLEVGIGDDVFLNYLREKKINAVGVDVYVSDDKRGG